MSDVEPASALDPANPYAAPVAVLPAPRGWPWRVVPATFCALSLLLIVPLDLILVESTSYVVAHNPMSARVARDILGTGLLLVSTVLIGGSTLLWLWKQACLALLGMALGYTMVAMAIPFIVNY